MKPVTPHIIQRKVYDLEPGIQIINTALACLWTGDEIQYGRVISLYGKNLCEDEVKDLKKLYIQAGWKVTCDKSDSFRLRFKGPKCQLGTDSKLQDSKQGT